MYSDSNMSTALLEPFVVLELGSRAGVGALGGLLAQLGAKIIAVEPKEGELKGKWRNRPVMLAGKKSIVVDQNTPRGAAELKDLVARADILLLSSDVDVFQREIWSAPRRRDLIVLDMTAYGHSGPRAGIALSDALVQAVTGVLDTTGPSHQPPTTIGSPLLEMHSAVLAATAIVAATRVRRLHGFGQRIDIALFDVGVTALINFVPLHLTGKSASRCGNRHPLYGAWGAFKAKDGWILICAAMDEQWKRLCEAMGRPELGSDPRFETTSGRLEGFGMIDEIISGWTMNLEVAECERLLIKQGVVCGPIVDVEDLDRQPNLDYRGSVRNICDPDGKSIKIPSSPLRGTPIGGFTPESVSGADQDRDEILSWPQHNNGVLVEGDERSSALPYEGIRVIEIGHYTVAPFASRIMGAMGADVIKVEAPAGDAVRKAAPLREDGSSYIFAMTNTDKRGVVLDLKAANDCKVLHQLLERADCLIENLKPGSLAKLGFDRETLRTRHPQLIYCAVNGFGADSIYPGRPALDTVIQAMSGVMSLTHANNAPTKTGISASDNLGGQFALLALAVGVETRERTGAAVHFDLSMQDASAWATQLEWNGVKRMRVPALVKAVDGYVAVEAALDEIKAHFDRSGTVPNHELRDTLVNATSAPFSMASVNTVGEATLHDQTTARELLVMRPTSDHDAWLVFTTPFKLLSTPVGVKSVISRLGSEGKQVLAELRI